MGNTLQEEQKQSIKNAFKDENGCFLHQPEESIARCSFGDNHNEQISSIESGIFAGRNRTHKSLECRTKQKLSLTKDYNCQSQAKLKLNRSASNDCKGIMLVHNKKPTFNYLSQIHFNRSAPRINTIQSETTIKKVPIKPRDLPRKVSTEKIIIFPQSHVKRVPLQPKIIFNPPISSPNIHISYARRPQTAKNEHSLQSSIVTPFIPTTYLNEITQKIQHPQQPKKLKKVALNRSYVNSGSIYEGYNNGEQSQPNKQNQKRVKGDFHQSLPLETKNQQENGCLFTDPQLYAYITNKPHPCINDLKNKYAVPVSVADQVNSHPSASNQNNYVPPIKLYQKTLRLEDAIAVQVESKALIQSDFHRFPTLTDVSEGSQTDNTSFIPIIRNSSSQKHGLQGQELLNFCRPKIDERVMADLQKLPIKN